MIIDRAPTEKIKIGLLVGSIVVVIAAAIIARLVAAAQSNETYKRLLKETPIFSIGKLKLNVVQAFCAVLVAMALFATANYTSYGEQLESTSYNSFDLLENYITPKYFDELGYHLLVPALVIADDEGNQYCKSKVSTYLAKNGRNYKNMSIAHALERREEVKEHFTPARWKQFVHDVSYLQLGDGNLSCRGWRRVIREKGFSGTPAWILVARPFTSLVPVEQVKWVASLDLVFVVAMLLVVAWAFGLQTMVFAWLFLCLSFTLRLNHIGGSILRYDWIAALVIGISMVKKDKPIAAGAFIGYATLMNYGSLLWLFGIAAKMIYQIVSNRSHPSSKFWRRVSVHYYKILLGFFVTVLLFVGVSVIRDGVDAQKASFENAAATTMARVSSKDVGLAIAAVYRGETEQRTLTKQKRDMVKSSYGVVLAVAIAAMLLLGLFLSRKKDYYAVGLGVLPFFWLVLAPFDFYVCLIVGVVIHAQDLTKARNVFGLLLIFLMDLFTNASQHLNPGEAYYLISNLSVLLTVYTFGMVAFLGWDWWAEKKSIRRGVGAE